MKRWQKVSVASAAGIGAVAAAGVLGHMGVFGDNFREVTPGRVYRCGQLRGDGFREKIKAYGLRAILNLRGVSKEDWYLEEEQACRETGVKLVNVDLWSDRKPAPKELQTLIETFEAGPYPLLLHCRSGADRSGLASALYLILVEKKPVTEAVDRELTWQKGHVRGFGAGAMDDFFELYLKRGGGKEFRAWALEDYPNLVTEAETSHP